MYKFVNVYSDISGGYASKYLSNVPLSPISMGLYPRRMADARI
nr:hypothetical protein [Candidatus Sigynarchaeum springense]